MTTCRSSGHGPRGVSGGAGSPPASSLPLPLLCTSPGAAVGQEKGGHASLCSSTSLYTRSFVPPSLEWWDTCMDFGN